MVNKYGLFGVCLLLAVTASAGAQGKSEIVEEIVVTVNNDVITLSDYQHAQAQLSAEAEQSCLPHDAVPACSPDQLNEKVAAAQKDLLRDLVDSSLLVQRGKDLGINVDNDVIKSLDDIRIENKIASMEELERQITLTGQDFDDYKAQIKNGLLKQEVIRREVAPKIIVDHATIQKYYDDHKDEFVRPEQVILREIFVSTDGKSDAEIPALRKKADSLLLRVRDGGEDFGELAKHFSDGSTARQGGDLGTFEKGQLAANIEALVFKMNRNDVTDVIPTSKPAGFEILQVRERYPAGQQPEDKVDSTIVEKLYSERMVPALRDYLETLRKDSYVEYKPGYVDSAAVVTSSIEEVPPSGDEDGKKSRKKKKTEE